MSYEEPRVAQKDSMTHTKNHSDSIAINHQEKQINALPDKEFKRIILRKLNSLQENKRDNSMKIRATIQNTNENFSKGLEIQKELDSNLEARKLNK